MSDQLIERRRLLETTGSVAVLALAGCTSTSAPGTDGSGGSAGTTTGGGHDERDHETSETTATETTQGDPDHSHHDGHHHEDVPDEPQSAAEVRMLTQGDSYHFSPHVTWVEEGATITFINESGRHSATAYAPGNDKPRRIPEGGPAFDTGLLTEQGATYEVTFDTAGIYDYYCIPHETVGMIGSIIVGDPDAHGQPGLEEPSELPEATHEKIRGLNDTANRALGHTHDESETTESGHHDESETTESGHHDDGGHHDESETTESGHHDDGGHHDESETTESGHHDDGGHHDESETTESGHHDDGHHG